MHTTPQKSMFATCCSWRLLLLVMQIGSQELTFPICYKKTCMMQPSLAMLSVATLVKKQQHITIIIQLPTEPFQPTFTLKFKEPLDNQTNLIHIHYS